MGRIWRLDLSTAGDAELLSYAIKEMFWGADEQVVAAEVRYRDAAAAAGIRAPGSLRTAEGHYLFCLNNGMWVRVYTWVTGRPSRREDPGRADWLGRTLGILHSLGYPLPQAAFVGWYAQTKVTRWERFLAAGASERWAPELAARVPQLRQLAAAVRIPDQVELVYGHNDIQPSNVHYDSNTGKYVLLDWDGVGPVHPGQELMSRLYTWHVHDGVLDETAVRRTLHAYRAAGGRAVIGSADAYGGVPAYLNYLRSQLELSLDQEQTPAMRTYAAREARNLLAEIPDPAILTTLVRLAREATGQS